jgi:hypothetical protein
VEAWLRRHAARFGAAEGGGVVVVGGGGDGGGCGGSGAGTNSGGGGCFEPAGGPDPVALFDMVTETYVVRRRP